MTTFSSSSGLDLFDADKRVNYSLGMIVGADDFAQDQRYLTARDEQHQRALHGWGVLSGLQLDFDGEELRVNPGIAVDGIGHSICVDTQQCADVLGWLNGLEEPPAPGDVRVWVLLCNAECETDRLPVPSGPCQSLDDTLRASRVTDSFHLELSLDEPQSKKHPQLDTTIVDLIDDSRSPAEKRLTLQEFVTGRGVEPAYAGPCLNAAGEPCVPLGAVDLAVDLTDAGFVFTRAPDAATDVKIDGRPIMLSTSFLQEWLLQAEGVSVVTTEPELSVMELTDTIVRDAPGDPDPGVDRVPDRSILRFDRTIVDPGKWVAEPLELDMVEDVDLSTTMDTADLYLGFDRSTKQWRPALMRGSDGDEPPVPPTLPATTLLGLPDTATINLAGAPERDISPGDVTDGSILRWDARREVFVPTLVATTDLIDVASTAPATSDVLTWTGTSWQPQPPSGGGPTTQPHDVRAREDQTIAVLAAGVIDLTFNTVGPDVRADGIASGLVASLPSPTYGNLTATPAGLFDDGGAVVISFDGLFELLGEVPELRRQLVVNVTSESALVRSRVRVAGIGKNGIVLRFALEKESANLAGVLEELQIERPEGEPIRLHVHVTLHAPDGENVFEKFPPLGVKPR